MARSALPPCATRSTVKWPPRNSVQVSGRFVARAQMAAASTVRKGSQPFQQAARKYSRSRSLVRIPVPLKCRRPARRPRAGISDQSCVPSSEKSPEERRGRSGRPNASPPLRPSETVARAGCGRRVGNLSEAPHGDPACEMERRRRADEINRRQHRANREGEGEFIYFVGET